MRYYTPVTVFALPVKLRFHFAGDVPRAFTNPLRVVQATRPAEVVPALGVVQRASEAGLYAAGYVTYEAAPAFDAALETHPPSGQPLLWFGIFAGSETPEPSIAPAAPLTNWALDTCETAYRAAIAGIRENIAAGVTYQTNYTVRLRSPETHPDPEALFDTLRWQHRPPYSSFLDTDDTKIISLSPELFFATEGARVTTRPMKGTAPRGVFSRRTRGFGRSCKRAPKSAPKT
jgi:para-aminobenzoate synthetase/4-amino-4-deoxychorismate lyase